jgi:ATP-dependent RNA helicase SUPV3L1/SUV3
VLLKTTGKDAGLLRVALGDGGVVTVEDHPIGHLEGFRFVVDASAGHDDRKLMLAAAERHMPKLLAQQAEALVARELGTLTLESGAILREGREVARLMPGPLASAPKIELAKELRTLEPARRAPMAEALDRWLAVQLAPLAPLRALEEAARDKSTGSEVRALLLTLVAGHGFIAREKAGLVHVPTEARPLLRKLGVVIGALDVFAPALLKPAARHSFAAAGLDRRPHDDAMQPVIAGAKQLPAGYRRAGNQAVRLDMAEKLFRAAHEGRGNGRKAFTVDRALATSMGLSDKSFRALMRDAGFRPLDARKLPEGAFGPPAPEKWSWRAPKKDRTPERGNPRERDAKGAFAALAELVR